MRLSLFLLLSVFLGNAAGRCTWKFAAFDPAAPPATRFLAALNGMAIHGKDGREYRISAESLSDAAGFSFVVRDPRGRQVGRGSMSLRDGGQGLSNPELFLDDAAQDKGIGKALFSAFRQLAPRDAEIRFESTNSATNGVLRRWRQEIEATAAFAAAKQLGPAAAQKYLNEELGRRALANPKDAPLWFRVLRDSGWTDITIDLDTWDWEVYFSAFKRE